MSCVKHTSSPQAVDEILTESGRARGVRVGTTEYHADVVLAGTTPKVAFLDLMKEVTGKPMKRKEEFLENAACRLRAGHSRDRLHESRHEDQWYGSGGLR